MAQEVRAQRRRAFPEMGVYQRVNEAVDGRREGKKGMGGSDAILDRRQARCNINPEPCNVYRYKERILSESRFLDSARNEPWGTRQCTAYIAPVHSPLSKECLVLRAYSLYPPNRLGRVVRRLRLARTAHHNPEDQSRHQRMSDTKPASDSQICI